MIQLGRRCICCFDKQTGELVKEIRFKDVTLRDLQRIFRVPADDEMIDLANQIAQDVDLARHFRAANDGRNRMRRVAERGIKRVEFRFHRPSGIGRQTVSDAFGRTVRAVCRRKGVVDVKIADLGKRIGEGRIVRFLTGIEARVFEHRYIARGEHRDTRLRALAPTLVVMEATGHYWKNLFAVLAAHGAAVDGRQGHCVDLGTIATQRCGDVVEVFSTGDGFEAKQTMYQDDGVFGGASGASVV